MPHTHTPQDGDQHNIPREGAQNPQGERPVSHFDKRRTHTHSGHGHTAHSSEGHKPHHQKPTEHGSHSDAQKPRHAGVAPKKFFGSMRQNQADEKLLPGSSYLFPINKRNKKSFPFSTPKQAIRKKDNPIELRPKPIEKDTLRIIPFGGLEQVGLNCMGFEYGNEIIIVDMGLQFPDQYQHGVSSSIPDLTYVHNKKIVAVLITHGHIDHIGAIPFLMRQIGKQIPLYATPMAYELIKMKQSEIDYQLTNIQEYHRNKSVVLSNNFTVTPFTVDHSIPDSVGLCIDTPVGRFIHTGDWKFDKQPLPHRPSTDYELLQNFGDRGVRALLSDSTNAHLAGSSISESEVIGSIDDIFVGAKARVITATFSSIIDRIILIIATSEKFGRKVVLLGRGMNNYMDIALKLGYARPQPGTLITMAEADKLPDDQVTICCTGAQGERYAALMRIATGESFDTSLKPTDTVVFSSSVIPGNERSVQGLFDIIMAQGPRICQYKESRIHAGGHAQEEDTKKMISLIRPEVYVPIYGFPFMLHGNAKNAYDLGYDENHVLIGKNGQIFEFTKDTFKLTNMYAPHRLVTVDGNMIGYSKEDVLHDRFQLSTGGSMVVSIAKKGGEYLYQFDNVGLPKMSEFPHLEKRLVQLLDTILQGDITKFRDVEALKKHIAKKIGDCVFDEIAKEPLVMVLAH